MNATQQQLPVLKRIAFIDWFGTLSEDRFWQSITDTPTNRLSEPLSDHLDHLFNHRKEMVQEWMRGFISEEAVINSIPIDLPANYGPDFLSRRLRQECERSNVFPWMQSVLEQLRRSAFVVVATDNMSCFTDALPRALIDSGHVDDVVASSTTGVLKAEDPQRFFGPQLRRVGLDWESAILIDDCKKTCEAFSELGGRSYFYTSHTRLFDELGRDGLIEHDGFGNRFDVTPSEPPLLPHR